VTDSEANAKALDSIAKAKIVVLEVTPDVVAEEIKAPVVKKIKQPIVKEEVVEKDVLPKVTSKEIVGSRMNSPAVSINPIYFDYESSWLNEKTRKELQKVIDLMKQNPKMVIECAGHADAKGDVKYNQWMSDRRVKRVVDYVISKGVSSSRISGIGYEEKFIINKCVEGVECTDQERAANRRVEFVIVKM
jgi:outer membrane protein OmpA-like peptidoglycan-associated protein